MRCDFAEWKPITANFTKGGMAPIRGVVPHCQVGNGSLQAFFSNPATQASAHFWCSKSGALEQYVDTDDKAWAEAAGNPYFVSVEFEGQVDEPMTSQQLDMGGRLIAWVYANVGQFPLVVNEHPDGQGITPHYAGGAAWGNHSCPGPLRFQQYDELVLAALRYLDDGTPLTPDHIDTGDDDLTPAQDALLVEIAQNLRKLLTGNAQGSGAVVTMPDVKADTNETTLNVRKILTGADGKQPLTTLPDIAHAVEK